MIMKELDVKFFENLLRPIKESLESVVTKQALENLPTKADLNAELQQLFESVTIHVGEELLKRDKIFNAELKQRDMRIEALEKKMDELQLQNHNIINAPTESAPVNQPVYSPEVFPAGSAQKEDVDVCLIGDSIIKHIELDRINPDGVNEKICKPGGKIEDARKQLKTVVKQKNVKRLILCTGTNHIPEEKPIEVCTKLLNLIIDAKRNMPGTQIFVSAVLPKYGNCYARGINFLNKMLFNASKLHNFDLVYNLQFQVDGVQNKTLFANDELHLNRRGVARLAMNFKYRLNKLSPNMV